MVGLFNWLGKRICKHRFALEDLKQTGIPEIPTPGKEGSYDEWIKYFNEYYEQDAVTKRVEWACDKCGKVFYAHCGLDILKHGTMFQRDKLWNE